MAINYLCATLASLFISGTVAAQVYDPDPGSSPLSFTKVPKSGLGYHGELTQVKWQLRVPSDRRREMSPEVPVQLTAKNYFAGQDPALGAIFRMILTDRPSSTKNAQ